MGIEVEVSEVRPELVYNKVHLEELRVIQDRPNVEPDQPHYDMQVTFRLYAVDENGTRFYSTKPKVISIRDYLTEAMVQAAQGDMRLINAMMAIESALSDVIENTGEFGTTTVV
jgi:hypothetical protein